MDMALSGIQQSQLKTLVQGKLVFDEPMQRYTTMKVGGAADVLVHPTSIDEVQAILQFAKQEGLPWTVLGRGSNLLVRDSGIRGIVMSLSELTQISCEAPDGDDAAYRVMQVDAGVRLKRLLGYCAEHGLSGVEGLEGVPGTVGGAVVMNAGTPAGCIGDAIIDVTYIEQGARIVTKKVETLKFSYRKNKIPRTAVVLSTRLRAHVTDPDAVREKLQQLRDKREAAQPSTQPGVGSVFRNPEGLSAWKLIDDAGLRGVRIGKARISEMHSNWIVNEGGATARDIETLIKLVRDKVKERCGVLLDPEVVIVGEA